jgi:hypothetical protein
MGSVVASDTENRFSSKYFGILTSLPFEQGSIHFHSFIIDSIQGDSRDKGNTLGGDSICHCEKKVHIKMCLILNGYRDRAVGMYKYNSIVSGNKEEIT